MWTTWNEHEIWHVCHLYPWPNWGTFLEEKWWVDARGFTLGWMCTSSFRNLLLEVYSWSDESSERIIVCSELAIWCFAYRIHYNNMAASILIPNFASKAAEWDCYIKCCCKFVEEFTFIFPIIQRWKIDIFTLKN